MYLLYKEANMRMALALVLLLSTVVGTGCVDEARIFYIRQNQIPTSGCKVAATLTIYQPMGVLDVSVGMGYWLYPLLENALKGTTQGDGQPERNALMLKGFEVQLDLQGMEGTKGWTVNSDRLKFWLPASGYMIPGATLVGRIKVIPDWLASEMAAPKGPVKAQAQPGGWPVVYAVVTAVAAKTGSEVESAVFVYPIEICNGCLVDKRDKCVEDLSKDKTVLYNYCGLPQDEPVTCCPKKNNTFACYQSSAI